MKELKSKKTGKATVYTEEEYAQIVHNKPDWLRRYEVTDVRGVKQITTAPPTEVKVKRKSHEGRRAY